jgi:two-component system cell cycle response regulator
MVVKILIVDDVATNRIVMKVKLQVAGYQPVLAANAAACLDLAARDVPDLILLDLLLPDMSGIDVLTRLRADPLTRSVPVVMFSASQDAGARARAFRAGADEFLTKPIDDQTLLARIRSFMRARDQIESYGNPDGSIAMLGLAEAAATYHPPGQVAIVTARSDTALRLRRDIATHIPDRVVTMTVEEALSESLNSGTAPDVFLIESDLGNAANGLRLMSELRSRTNTRHAAFCLLVPVGSVVGAAVAFDLGANDMVSATVPGEEIALRLARLLVRKREADQMRTSVQDGLRLAMFDPLTGLHNRRYGAAQLSAIAERACKSGTAFAVMVVDLDRFKSVNDRWGHAAGDAVLVEVAGRLAQNLRGGDLLARIGGEEFLIALPDTSLAEARGVAERLCHAVEESPMRLGDGATLRVTVSIGLAISTHSGLPDCIDAVSEIVDRADRALLVSKSGGRNQVTISRTAA